MLKRILTLFLSVLIIGMVSSCKKDREFYQGEQTVYIQCSNGLLLDVRTMIKSTYEPIVFKPYDPLSSPTFEKLEKIREKENGVILLVTVEEYPVYSASANEKNEWSFVFEAHFRVDEVFYTGSSSIKKQDVLSMKNINVAIRTTEPYCNGETICAPLAHLTEGFLDVSDQISWTMDFPYSKNIYEDGTPVKKTFPFMRKGYSYIIYGTVNDGEFQATTNYSIIEVATAEDHAKFYENLGLEDPEFAEISAQVLEKYWYN